MEQKRRHEENLKSVSQTAEWAEKLVRQFHYDVKAFDGYEFKEFHDYVLSLPYKDDGADEQLSRPKWTLPPPQRAKATLQGGARQVPVYDRDFESKVEFRDCDDKAIIIGCWLYRQLIPFRFIACAYEPGMDIHHCILQTYNPRMFIDATYPDEDAFPPTKKYYNVTPLTGWIKREN